MSFDLKDIRKSYIDDEMLKTLYEYERDHLTCTQKNYKSELININEVGFWSKSSV